MRNLEQGKFWLNDYVLSWWKKGKNLQPSSLKWSNFGGAIACVPIKVFESRQVLGRSENVGTFQPNWLLSLHPFTYNGKKVYKDKLSLINNISTDIPCIFSIQGAYTGKSDCLVLPKCVEFYGNFAKIVLRLGEQVAKIA